MKKYINIILLFFLFTSFNIFSEEGISFDFFLIQKNNFLSFDDCQEYIYQADRSAFLKTYESYYDFERYKYQKKEELLLRRSEILFFGSLTFVTFGSWFFFSLFNVFIYNEPFGKIKREQFIPMIFGSGTISIAVVLTDVFMRVKPKLDEKNIEVYK